MNPSDPKEPWEHWFNELKNLEPARPKPFFYTRLEVRLKAHQQEAVAEVIPWWLRKPAYALAALGLLIGLNLAVALISSRPDDRLPEGDQYTYEGFASEYQLNRQGMYADE